MLTSNQAMFIAWGTERTLLYNDAYAEILASKHPAALGRDLLQVWHEIRDGLAPIVERTYAGHAVHMDDIQWTMHRRGYPEETHFSFFYAPVRDEAGAVAGLFCACAETTEKVFAERRVAAETLRQRRLFEQAPGFICILTGPDHVFEFTNAACRRVFGERDFDGNAVRDVFPELEGQGFYELLDQVYTTGERFVAHQTPIQIKPPSGETEERFLDFIYEPIKDQDGRVTGIFCEGFDVTEAHQTSVILRESEERQRFRAELGDAMRPLVRPEEIQATATRLLCEHLGASRVHYAEIEPDGEHAVVPDDHAPTVPNRAGRYRLADFGVLIGECQAVRTFVASDLRTDPRLSVVERAMYADLPVAAMVVVPLVKDGRFGALLSVHRIEPHAWSEGELALIEEVAARTWDAIERARAEAALRESEARFRLTADAVPQIVWITDAEGRAEFFNKQWFDYVGTAEQPATAGDVAKTYLHPDDEAPTMAAFDEARRTGTTYTIEHRIRSKTGEFRWFLVRGVPFRDPDTGQTTRWFGASVDIDDRKSAEAALRESEARFRNMADSVPALIWMSDGEGQVTFANMHYEYLFGRPAADMLDGGWADIVLPDDLERYTRTFLDALHARAPFHCETRVIDKEGNVRWLRCEGVPRLDDSGRFLGYTGCNVDVTEGKLGEQRRDLLIHELNHRVKNTLATVQSIATQTLRSASDPQEAREAIENRLIALSQAHDVLTRESWESVGLREVVERALDPFRGQSSERIIIRGTQARLPPRMALALSMALHELATNAVKYGALSNEAGEVLVTWLLDHTTEPESLLLRWEERGGPPVEA
ncbi:MAG TPA: PAS domain-containing protein, partial [Microvirga sp.]